MLRAYFLIIFCNFSYSIFAQNSDNCFDNTKDNSISNLLENYIKLSDGYYSNLNNNYSVDCGVIFNALDNNVWGYFNLNDTYNTELKRNIFSASPEFAQLSDSLKKVKEFILNSCFFYETNQRNSSLTIDDYDFKKGGFYINLENHFLESLDLGFHPFEFTSEFKFFLPIKDKSIALEIEENRFYCSLLFIFKPIGIVHQNMDEMIKINSLKLILINNQNEKKYFEHVYIKTSN